MKVPWKAILKVGGVVALGVSSIMSAMDTDKKTQELIKKVAEKASSTKGES